MQLYQTYLSPFPTRVRLMLYAKGIDCEIVEPPGFHGDPRSKGSYLAINPIGRVPALVLDDGRVLPESEVICEYLEEAFPEPPLFPSRAVAARPSATVVAAIGFLRRDGDAAAVPGRRETARTVGSGRNTARRGRGRQDAGSTRDLHRDQRLCSGELAQPCRRHAGADSVAGRGVDADFSRT